MLHTIFQELLMVAKKTAALNIRIHPDLKEAIRIAAKRDHLSIANMVEMLILKHCGGY